MGLGVLEVKWQGQIDVGSVVVAKRQLLWRRTDEKKIIGWEPPHKLAVEATSGARVNAAITMDPLEGGKTRLTRLVLLEIGGLLRLIQPYMSNRAKRGRSVELENVKRIVEAQSPSV